MNWDAIFLYGGIIIAVIIFLIAYLYCPILQLLFWVLVVLILMGVV